MSTFCDFLSLFDHSGIHSVVFVPLVIQDFLFRVDLESFALSVPPLLFEPSTLGKVTQKSFAWEVSLPHGWYPLLLISALVFEGRRY